MSFLGKKWIIRNQDESKNLIEKLLLNRNIEDQATYFADSEELALHDPFLFTDMQKAVERLEKAIKQQEKIIVFGDYDADGISGAAVLIHALRALGASVSYRLPHRVNDGYGFSDKFVDEFIDAKINVVITVDCGISNAKQIEKAQNNNIDVIITDHHTVPEQKPPAFAIIHPKLNEEKYPFKELTGSGVAFKLAQALYQSQGKDDFEELLDLATLGTVADMGPLKGENRLIVKKGLKKMTQSKWYGLELLKKIAGIEEEEEVSARHIGFQICPRINAAGRIDTPYLALQLLLHELEQEKSKDMAESLEKLNKKRQELTKTALEEVEKKIKSIDSKKILIESDANWHVGIVGLVAGRLAEKYNLPAIILQDLGEHLVASCRSPEYFNVTEALAAHKDLLVAYGGHPQAAGFTIKKANLEEFTEKLNEYTAEKLQNIDTQAKLNIDCEIPEESLNLKTFTKLEQMQPFGIGNEKPSFLISDCEIDKIKQVGSDKTHLKLRVKKGENYLDAIGFSFGEAFNQLREHKKVDLVAHLEKNSWKGRNSLQLRIVDLRPSNQ